MKIHPRHERVLLIEDDLVLAGTIASLLQEGGYVVSHCQRSTDLERTLAGHGFDLALIELNLGEHGGLSLLPRLRRLSALAEIVVMTSDALLHSVLEAIQSGVHAYLPKPFELEELLAVTRRALAQVALKRERQALSERVALSESLYRSVVETVEACIIGLDAQGVITFANRFAARCLEASEPLLGRSLIALSDEHGGRRLAAALARAQAGESVRDQDVRHPQAAGARSLRWSFSPLHPLDTRAARVARDIELVAPTVSVLAVGQDLTDRIAMEQRTAADRALAAVGTLTTGLAHEIRNPLNAAKLQLELMQRRAKRGGHPQLAARLIEPAQLVRTEIERLTKMLDEFLSLARPSSPAKVSASVRELFAAVIASEANAARRAGIVLLSVLDEPELRLELDREKLLGALQQLVRNSLDALEKRGRGEVVLRARRLPEGSVELAVLDDGPGLPHAMHGRAAFEPFATTKPAGTGLGLALVQSAVVQHGGEVELADRPEGGTIARIRL